MYAFFLTPDLESANFVHNVEYLKFTFRNQILIWLKAIDPLYDSDALSKDQVIYCKDIENNVIHFILSEYKIELWIMRNKIKFEAEKLNTLKIIHRIDNKTNFYLTHILNNP